MTTFSGQRHVLLVIRQDGTSDMHPLPPSGLVTVGRSPQNQVCIDDPSISRRHAVLHMESPICVEDLGSANGTRISDGRQGQEDRSAWVQTVRVRDNVVAAGQKVALQRGDVIHFGAATAFVQSGAPAPRPRRLWPHGTFEACLEKECQRSERSGSGFAVLRVHIEGAVATTVVQEVLGACTRSADLVALYGPNDYEVLLVDANADKVDDVRSRLQSGLTAIGAKARLGVARYPSDGRDPDSLLAKAGARSLGAGTDGGSNRGAVVIEDPAMQGLYQMAQRIAGSEISVILLGETGVGKEVLAETIHMRSPRAAKPFLRLNCAAFAEQLLESELFGHERGAFTGATQAKPGLLETANGGTVFLDEVGELPPLTQVKLLRVLEERKVLPVGGVKVRSIDVRFVAATNRDLEAEIERGAFRQDLFFRLNGISLLIPPLRERPSEIPVFARTFLEDVSRRAGRQAIPDIDPQAMALLLAYRWPGNIRELRNVMERAFVLCSDDVITTEHMPVEAIGEILPPPDRARQSPPALPEPGEPSSPRWRGSHHPTLAPLPEEGTLDPTHRFPAVELADLYDRSPEGIKEQREEADRKRVLAALDQCAGNQTQAAKLLGISRRTLVTRLERYKLPRPQKRS